MGEHAAIDAAFVRYCWNGACFVVLFFNNAVTQDMCPFCGTLGDRIGRIETASNNRRITIEEREHTVGRSGERQVDGGRRPLYEDVQLPERVRDNDSKEEG